MKFRENLLAKEWREELHKYISGIIKAKGHKSIIVNGVTDHVHCFIGLKPGMAISDLVRDIKAGSSNFINQQYYVNGKFNWQEGFGAFSYSKSQIDIVIKYILSQEEHHKKTTFREEYFDFLEKFEIDYDEKYLFEWIE